MYDRLSVINYALSIVGFFIIQYFHVNEIDNKQARVP